MNEIFLKWKEIAGQEDGIHKIKEILFWRLGGYGTGLNMAVSLRNLGRRRRL